MSVESKNTQKPKSNQWFAGGFLVFLVIIAIAAIYPVYLGSRPVLPRTACLSNLKQLGISMAIYTSDFDDHYCPSNWNAALYPYAKNWDLFSCPDVRPKDFTAGAKPTVSGYAFNYRLVGASPSKVNEHCVLVFETDALSPDVVASVNARNGRHDGKSSVLFADTSARLVPIAEVVRGEP